MARNIKEKNDKFYTKTELVCKLLETINISDYDLVIEPSAGNGSFSKNIHHNNLIALDIEPEDDNIIKMNWFDFELGKKYNKILVIGNPPFGNQSKTAIKFIDKASRINAHTIAFILPKSFKKHTLQNKIPLNYHLVKEIELDDDSYLLNNSTYNVPSIFQIWEKRDILREKIVLKTKSKLFDFVKKTQNPDFSFRRVGFYAGKIYDNINKSEQSHYFIKSKINIDILKKIFNEINWIHNNTTGPKSIGKGELIKEIEKKFYNKI